MATDEPTTDSRGRRAQHRLRDMLTTGVGLVDRAANEQTFLVIKSEDGGMTTKADGDVNQGGLRLPADAKQSLTDGLADVLEQIAAIAQQVQDCVVDESAECPPELASSIDGIADDLDELAEEFTPKASAAEMKQKGAARKANKVAKAKAFPGAAPPFGSKDKDEADNAAGEVAKGPLVTTVAGGSAGPLGSPAGGNVDTSGPKKDPPGEGGAADETNLQPRGTAENPDVVMKSGRKIAKARLESLTKGYVAHKAAHELHGQAISMAKSGLDHLDKCMKGGGSLADLHKGAAVCKAACGMDEQAHSLHAEGHDHIDKVMKEVGDPGFMQPPGAAPSGPPASPKPPPAEPVVSPPAGTPDTTSMAKSKAEMLGLVKDEVQSALADPIAKLNATMDGLKAIQKSMGDAASLEKLRGLTGTPRSAPNDGSAPPSAPPKSKFQWPTDMAQHTKQRAAASK